MANVHHNKKGKGTYVYIRPEASSTAADYKLLGELTNFELPGGEADEIDITTHNSPNNTRQFEPGLFNAGEATLELLLNLNATSTPGTGVSQYNEAQIDLLAAVGTETLFDVLAMLPPRGTVPAAVAAPAPEVANFTFIARVKTFDISAPMDDKLTATCVLIKSTRPTFTKTAVT